MSELQAVEQNDGNSLDTQAQIVASSLETTKLGGITGKGWLPGQSGNPEGRKPTRVIGEYLKFKLEQAGYTEKIGDQLLAAAAGEIVVKPGQIQAADSVMDRTEGKPIQTTNVRGLFVMMPPEGVISRAFDESEPDI